jgi:hypothetical protein
MPPPAIQPIMQQTRIAASWNAKRVHEQNALKEAVPKFGYRTPKPSVDVRFTATVNLAVASTELASADDDGDNAAEDDADAAANDDDDANDDDIPDISGFIDIDITDDDDEKPAHAWIRQLATMHLTAREATAMKPFLALADDTKSAGPFSRPLTFRLPPFLPLQADAGQVRS